MIGDVISFFGAPTIEGGVGKQNQFIQNYGMYWCIGAKNYDNALCREWLSYVFSHYGDVGMSANGAITGYFVSEDIEVPGYTQMVLGLFDTAGTPCIWGEALLSAEAATLAQNNIQLLITGDITPEEYGKQMNEVVGFAE